MRSWLPRGRTGRRIGAASVVLLGACAAAAIWLAASPEKAPTNGAVAKPRDLTTVVTATGKEPPFRAPSLQSTFSPGRAILTSTVGALDVFDAPGGAVTRELDQYTRYAFPLTLMAVDSQTVDGETWYQVLLPAKPNGQTGWVAASNVSITSTDTVIRVYIEERQLDVIVDGAVVLTAPVAVGAPATPTPLGTFYVTDPIDLTANPSPVYGTYAMGLSGYSEALETFKGTLPQIAIHGTYAPHLVGQPVSNGCLRMKNDAVVQVAAFVGLGTPVIIGASRVDS